MKEVKAMFSSCFKRNSRQYIWLNQLLCRNLVISFLKMCFYVTFLQIIWFKLAVKYFDWFLETENQLTKKLYGPFLWMGLEQ